MPPQTKIASYCLALSAGVWESKPAATGAFESGPSRLSRRDKGSLYVLVDVTGDPIERQDIARQLVSIVRRGYFRASGSITFCLQQALKAANAWLLQKNQADPLAAQRTASASIAVIRGDDLFVAQAGSALAYFVRPMRIERFPTQLPPRERLTPLGIRRDIAIDLFRAPLQPGDRVLLASSALAASLKGESLRAVMAQPGGSAALDQLASLAGDLDFSALLIDFGAREVAPTLPYLPLARGGEEGLPPRKPVRPVEVEEEEIAPPLKPRAEAPARQVPLPLPPAAAGEGRDRGAARQAMGRIPLGGLASAVSRAVSDVGGALLGATGTLLRRTLPGREPVPRRDRSATEAPPRRRAAPSTQPLRIISLAFPILIAFLVVSVLVQYRTAQDRNYSIRIVQARDNVAAAQAQSNKDAARQLLSEADSLISEALLVKPNDREALVLQAQVHQLLDQVSLVVRLPSLTELVTLPDNSVPSRVIVHGIDVNVLDPAMQRIYKFLLNDSHSAILPPENEGVLMRKGDQRGSIVVSDLIDIVWMEAGGERKGSNLLALESGGTILEYDPSKGIAALTVADSQNWQSPKVIGSYGGNLYVLDTQRSQILRYKPQANAYTRPPENYIDASNPTDLAGAVDMAIDGYIYVLFADGKLIKFDGGKLAPFPQSDLDVPLRSPRAIFTSIAAKSVYVADTGNQRVVEFSKEGEMLRQFRPADQQKEAFADLRGLFVDEAEKKLYVTSGRKLYLVSLPEPPQPTPIPPPTPTSPP